MYFKELFEEWNESKKFGIFFLIKFNLVNYVLNTSAILCIFYGFDWLFDGNFIRYGPVWFDWFRRNSMNGGYINPMDRFLPKMTKCSFRR